MVFFRSSKPLLILSLALLRISCAVSSSSIRLFAVSGCNGDFLHSNNTIKVKVNFWQMSDYGPFLLAFRGNTRHSPVIFWIPCIFLYILRREIHTLTIFNAYLGSIYGIDFRKVNIDSSDQLLMYWENDIYIRTVGWYK